MWYRNENPSRVQRRTPAMSWGVQFHSRAFVCRGCTSVTLCVSMTIAQPSISSDHLTIPVAARSPSETLSSRPSFKEMLRRSRSAFVPLHDNPSASPPIIEIGVDSGNAWRVIPSPGQSFGRVGDDYKGLASSTIAIWGSLPSTPIGGFCAEWGGGSKGWSG